MRIEIRGRIARAAAAAAVTMLSVTTFAAETVSVNNPWVRATVPGQSVAGAYMDITAKAPAVLLAIESPVAARVELHTMAMDGGVMKMRPLEKLDLPANRTVNLKPGGYHVMLVDIKRELKAGERVPLKLTLQDRKGVKSTLQVEAEVRAVTGGSIHHNR